MRVGVLTFHRIYNPGAFWQAFATVQTLQRMGHDPVVIDYTSPRHRSALVKKLFNPVTWRFFRSYLDSLGKIRAYGPAQRRLPMTGLLSNYRQLEQERFDAVVVGSDIIWDFKTRRLGNDPVYFGAHLNTPRLIAYAPSCGSTGWEEPAPAYVEQGLRLFHAIAVRDENTRKLVKKQTGVEAPVIADPTFNLDFEGLSISPSIEEPYLLFYGVAELLSPEYREAIVRFARARGLKIVAVGYRQTWADRNEAFADPFEWLGWIEHAQYVATNTFHGTLFSIFLRKRFATELNSAIITKTEKLLKDSGLENRVFRKEYPLEELMTHAWWTQAVEDTIKKYAQSARTYLEQALNEHCTTIGPLHHDRIIAP